MKDHLSRERYYITDIFTSQDDPVCGLREEMEPELAKTLSAFSRNHYSSKASFAIINGERAGLPPACTINIIQEQITYMADYEFNEQGEIEAVHYDPVPVVKRKRAINLQSKKGGRLDTPLPFS